MARFRTEGLDELIADMDAMGASTGELADDMLMAGAEEVKKAWKTAIRKHRLIDTRDMVDSVGYARSVKKVGDIKSVDIYPRGKNRKGVRNAEVAFVNHYGKSSKKGTHFVDDADDMAGPLVENKLTKMHDDWLAKHGMK